MRAVIPVVLAILVAMAVWWTWPGTLPTQQQVSGGERTSAPPARVQEPMRVEPLARRAVAAREAALVVVDADSDLPLEDASLHGGLGANRRVASTQLAVIAQADRSGKVYRDQLAGRNSVIVRSPGHAAAHVAIEGDEPIVVRLQKGHRAIVSVIAEDGQPLPGTTVCLHHLASPLTFPHAYKEPAFGNPECEAWIFVGVTGADGVAVIDDVPAGDYRVRSSAPELCASRRVEITLPGGEATIRLEELFAIVALPASDAAIDRCHFKVDIGKLEKSACALAQRPAIEARLKARFPGAAVFVARPEYGRPLPAEITAILDDGSIAKGSWALQPIRAIDNPVFLEVVERRGVGSIRIELRHEDRSSPRVPLTACRKAGAKLEVVEHFVSGSPVHLPAGTYSFVPNACMSYLDDVFAGRTATIEAGVDQVMEVELPWPLTEVVVHPVMSDGVYDVPIHVGYSHPAIRVAGMSANWMPGMPPIRFMLPPGEVEIFADAATAKRVPRKLIITGKETEPIELTLAPGES